MEVITQEQITRIQQAFQLALDIHRAEHRQFHFNCYACRYR